MCIMDNLLGVRDGAVLLFMSKPHTSSNLFLIEGKWALVASAGSKTITGLGTVNPSFSATSPWKASHSAGLPA